MRAFPSFMEMDGHPSPMQRLQLLHFSGSTRSGAFGFTYFSSTQGRREMMTLGSSSASSSFTASSHSFRL